MLALLVMLEVVIQGRQVLPVQEYQVPEAMVAEVVVVAAAQEWASRVLMAKMDLLAANGAQVLVVLEVLEVGIKVVQHLHPVMLVKQAILVQRELAKQE